MRHNHNLLRRIFGVRVDRARRKETQGTDLEDLGEGVFAHQVLGGLHTLSHSGFCGPEGVQYI